MVSTVFEYIEQDNLNAIDAFYNQCYCWKGVATKPDNTVIQGLGFNYIELPNDVFLPQQERIAVINEPTGIAPVLCFTALLAIFSRHV